MTPALLLKKLDALIGTSAAHVWQNARWANGPLSGVMVPAYGDWSSLASALINRGPANWVGKHVTSTWCNDEGSLGEGACELLCCSLTGGITPTTILATFREFLRVLDWMMQLTGDLPPLCWNGAAKIDVGSVAQHIYETKSALDDCSARKLAGALALGSVVFGPSGIPTAQPLEFRDICDQCRLLLRRLADRIARIVRRHGGCAAFHDPITDDMSSGRAFEAAELNTAATADAMLILEIAAVILGDAGYAALATELSTRLRTWEYRGGTDANGMTGSLTVGSNTWDLWVRPLIPGVFDRVIGVGRNDSGGTVRAEYAIWPSQDPKAPPANGIPRADYPRRQLERFEYSRTL